MKGKKFFDDLVETIQQDSALDEAAKAAVYRNFTKLKDTKVNLLITGATGCGKSSTINALFNTDHAKVGQGVDPETMEITRYELDNIVLFDSPGLGDGKDADIRHSKGIIEKLFEKDERGVPLIDLVLVILDGSSRDLGTSFELINSVIIPNLGDDHSRLLVAINQADMAMKGRFWNQETNQPESALVSFLEEKVTSTKRRIKEATDVDVDPIYYSAGYKDAGQAQKPYNLSKLLLQILRHTKAEKRAVFAQDVNTDEQMWRDDDRLLDYRKEIQLTVIDSIKINASIGSDMGGEIGSAIGSLLGKKGQILGEVGGKVAGALIGGVVGFFRSFF
ncbi:GTP-binding protein [Pseudomonas sp. PB103]|uniref:GTPase n=1 Tax=Pseudomonas sp. PB103 TaxID=2494698 RepID=UPI00131B8656|nr:GTPase [Pseudomonas sp. PB103]KAE9647786.1 GTP-binding protein [Pseudomonas sp. PB103]